MIMGGGLTLPEIIMDVERFALWFLTSMISSRRVTLDILQV